MRLSLHFLGILLLSLACLSAGAESQRKLTSYQKYISKYSDLAIQHQKKYRIPASITLAQGLLESGAGQSDLARRSNNHFGICVIAAEIPWCGTNPMGSHKWRSIYRCVHTAYGRRR